MIKINNEMIVHKSPAECLVGLFLLGKNVALLNREKFGEER